MADQYYLTEDQVRRLKPLLNWYESVGRYLGPPTRPLPGVGRPVPMMLGVAAERIAPCLKSTDLAVTTGGRVHPMRFRPSLNVPSTPMSTYSTGTIAEDTGTTYHAYPAGGIGAADNEPVLMFRHQVDGRLYFTPLPQPRAEGTLCVAGTSSTAASTAGWVSIHGVRSIWGPSPATSTSAKIAVYNWPNYPIQYGRDVKIEYNRLAGQWEIYAIQGEQIAPVYDLRAKLPSTVGGTSSSGSTEGTSPELQLQRKRIWTPYTNAASSSDIPETTSSTQGWETWAVGTMCSTT